MRSLLSVLLVVLFSSLSYGQYSLGNLNANRYDYNSLSNAYGAGSRYRSDGLMNPYSRYGSPYSDYSWTNPYASNPPRIYSQSGRYLGELSSNPYASDSISNPYGRYGSPYSPESINNPYGYGSPYSTERLYVWPRGY